MARDAMGIKLVYYKVAGGRLTFGSEIRALLAAEPTMPDVDPTALNLFLKFRYTPSPLTIFKGIRKLAPGTMLVVEAGKCSEERWYNYTPVPFPDSKSEEEATNELLDLYKGAVKRHLLSEVPVGILLSGGLDSGLLLALMQDHGREWPSYTVGYGSTFEDDELTDAAETASLLGGRHVAVRLDRREFERSLPAIIGSLRSRSPHPRSCRCFVCQRAREMSKWRLSAGADELFAVISATLASVTATSGASCRNRCARRLAPPSGTCHGTDGETGCLRAGRRGSACAVRARFRLLQRNVSQGSFVEDRRRKRSSTSNRGWRSCRKWNT